MAWSAEADRDLHGPNNVSLARHPRFKRITRPPSRSSAFQVSDLTTSTWISLDHCHLLRDVLTSLLWLIGFPAGPKLSLSVTSYPLPVPRLWCHTGLLVLGPHYTYLPIEGLSSPPNSGCLFPACWEPNSTTPQLTIPSQMEWLSVSTAT